MAIQKEDILLTRMYDHDCFGKTFILDILKDGSTACYGDPSCEIEPPKVYYIKVSKILPLGSECQNAHVSHEGTNIIYYGDTLTITASGSSDLCEVEKYTVDGTEYEVLGRVVAVTLDAQDHNVVFYFRAVQP